ncbi:MAG TPA: hypothetical protein VGI10_29485 [Polyangiaceae bacterium]|jgi:hypothetical protein
MLKLYEKTADTGQLVGVFLQVSAERLELIEGANRFDVPDAALDAVMRRYGTPFDPNARIARIDSLELGLGRSLLHVRHLAGYDVIARDYVVYEASALDEPLCALSVTVAGALMHLARRSEP